MNKAAQALGRLAKGKPKNYSPEEIERRSKILAGINARKRKASKAKKRRIPERMKNPAAVALGRLGGQATSEAKADAARENAKKGGWPKGKPRKPKRKLRRPNCKRPLRFAASGCWASVELSSTSKPQK